MTGYFALLKKHPQELSFGLIQTFFSGFGQTFFISLFVPPIMQSFQLGRADWGMYYSLCTLTAALTHFQTGRWIDYWKIEKYTLLAGVLLSSACFFAAWSPNLPVLLLSLYLLRLGGQSFLSHIASTTMSRYFDKERGKALGIINLGYPLSEAVLPLLLTLISSPFGWRGAFIAMLCACTFLYLPMSYFLIKQTPNLGPIKKTSQEAKDFDRVQLLKDWRFLALIPIYTAPPFLITGFFIHQDSFSSLFPTWNLKSISMALAGFALLRGSGALLVGPLIDRFSSPRLLPYYTLPLLIGISAVLFTQSTLAPLLLFTFAGLTAGIGGSIKSSFLAEYYGVANLGSIRSLMSTFMVLSTSASPWLFGTLLENHIDLKTLLWGTFIFLNLCICLILFALKKPRRILN